MKSRTFTYQQVISLLCSNSPKCEAVLLQLALLGEATTGQVARALGWDRSNTGRRLEALAEDGLVELVDECHTVPNKPGRPSRLWRLA